MRTIGCAGPGFVTLAVTFALTAAGARAEMRELPLDLPVDAPGVDLELRNSRVDVLLSRDADARLVVTDARGDEITGGYVAIEAGEDGALVVRQPWGDEAVAPDVRVRLVLPPGTALTIRGERLDVDLEGERAAPGERPATGRGRAGGGGGGAGRASIRIDVDDSSVRITRVSGIDLEGSGGFFDLAATAGAVTARLERAGLRTAGHRGSLVLAGSSLDAEAQDVNGTLRAVLDGGGLTVGSGEGRLRAELRAAQLLAQRWAGPVEVAGSDATVELRAFEDDGSTVRVDLSDGQVLLEGLAGGLSGQLRAGRIEARDIGGAVNLTARESAEIELEGLGQACRLDLQDGARGRVRGVAGRLAVRVTDAEIEAEGALELDLRAERGIADVSGVTRQVRLVAVDSDLDVDCTQARGQAELQARGTSVVRMRLPQPCEVRHDGSDAARDALAADGCELVGRGERRPRVIRPRGRRPPLVLEAKVDAGTRVEITGVP
ncbi:MAG: hypothetical protein Kow0062_02200 [Acidobacteriota bacterium]